MTYAMVLMIIGRDVTGISAFA
jgi:hypothetical protein